MSDLERQRLVAPCGLDCGICECYICKDNEPLHAYLVSRGIPESNLPCPGCRAVEGNCPAHPSLCATYSCVTENNLQFCSDCRDFPCSRFNPTVDRAEILPHNMKVFNLATIKNHGVEPFIGNSQEIKEKYYKGKMIIGEGPILE